MVREHKEFLLKLIPRLYHEAGVRCIGWEFLPPLRQPTVAGANDCSAGSIGRPS